MKKIAILILILGAINLNAQTIFNYNVPCGSVRYYQYKNEILKARITDTIMIVNIIDNSTMTEQEFWGITNEDMHISLTKDGDSVVTASMKYLENGTINYYEGQSIDKNFKQVPQDQMIPIDFICYDAVRRVYFNNKQDSISLVMNHRLPVAANTVNETNSKLLEKAFHTIFEIPDNASYPEDYVKSDDIKRVHDYTSIYESGEEEPEFIYTGNWQAEEYANIILNTKDLLCVEKFGYDYSGGAHGVHGYIYYNYDYATGKVLELKDIFTGDYEKTLSKLINQNIYDQNKDSDSDENATLSDLGFFVDPVFVTTNFALKEHSITFTYNIYEIGPYAFGATVAEIPYSQLKSIIKKDGAISRLIK